jgi:tRNA A-37 threonylcarbamoyl transferase component Bud32
MLTKETDFDKLPPTINPGQLPMDDSWVDKVPEAFGNYTRVAELGKGGFGIVYHVRHRSLGFDRALKVLDPRIAAEAGEKQRFLREARVLAGLHHVPQVVHIHEVSPEDDPWNWLLMELISGLRLAENYHAVSAAQCLEWHRQTNSTGEGRLPEAMVLRILCDVLAALQAAHEKGVIHRDLKPGNILLMPDGGAKLADFGLVKLVDGKAGAEEKGQISTRNLPNSNRYMGTTAYMSPEQQDGLPLDARSDIYSLGLVIYELLVGHRPGLRMKLPHQMGLPVAAWWDDVLDRMLETRPADRPSSAAELAAALPGDVTKAASVALVAEEETARQETAAQQAEAVRVAVERVRTEELARTPAEAGRIAAGQERALQEELVRKCEFSLGWVSDIPSSAKDGDLGHAAATPVPIGNPVSTASPSAKMTHVLCLDIGGSHIRSLFLPERELHGLLEIRDDGGKWELRRGSWNPETQGGELGGIIRNRIPDGLTADRVLVSVAGVVSPNGRRYRGWLQRGGVPEDLAEFIENGLNLTPGTVILLNDAVAWGLGARIVMRHRGMGNIGSFGMIVVGTGVGFAAVTLSQVIGKELWDDHDFDKLNRFAGHDGGIHANMGKPYFDWLDDQPWTEAQKIENTITRLNLVLSVLAENHGIDTFVIGGGFAARFQKHQSPYKVHVLSRENLGFDPGYIPMIGLNG